MFRESTHRLRTENELLNQARQDTEKDTIDVITYLKKQDTEKDKQVRTCEVSDQSL